MDKNLQPSNIRLRKKTNLLQLTRVVPTAETFGLTQGLHVPVHIALGALLLLGGNCSILVLRICPLRDVLRGTAGRGWLLDQPARAILIDTHLVSNTRGA